MRIILLLLISVCKASASSILSESCEGKIIEWDGSHYVCTDNSSNLSGSYISIGSPIPPGQIDLSTVTAALTGKVSADSAVLTTSATIANPHIINGTSGTNNVWGLVEGMAFSSMTITGSTYTVTNAVKQVFSTHTIKAGSFTQIGDQYTLTCVYATQSVLPTTPLIYGEIGSTLYPSAAPATASSWYYLHLSIKQVANNIQLINHWVVSFPTSGAIPLYVATNGTGATARGISFINTSSDITLYCSAKKASGSNLNFISSELIHGSISGGL